MIIESADWNFPTTIKAGAGRVRELAQACRDARIRSPLIVTDPGLAKLPPVEQALAVCHDSGLRAGVFQEADPDPTEACVIKGVKAFRAGGHDGVIALGGGSALDTGKAVALMVGQGRPLWDFIDEGDNYRRVNVAGMAPVIAVPTTAGTGSEVGRAAVITDEQAHMKRVIFHPRMLPGTVILDPLLSVGLPPALTAACGMEALAHNIEAYCATGTHPMAAGIALEAIRLIREHLPTAVRDGQNVQARYNMLIASTMGATAMQRGLGAMQALAQPIGSLYHAHHGLLNGILMPYVLAANARALEGRLTALGRYLGLADATGKGVLDWIVELRREIGIAHTLTEIGIPDDQAAQIAAMAAEDVSSHSNAVPLDASAYERLFRAAIAGDRVAVASAA